MRFYNFSIQKEMFKRFFDFVVHLKKQSILYPAVNSTDIHDVKEMVYLVRLTSYDTFYYTNCYAFCS